MEKDFADSAPLRAAADRANRNLLHDQSGAVIIEAAFVLPVVILLLLGAVSYGMWFMAAHSVQQAANEGARAVLAGIDEDDRQAIVEDVVATGVLATGTVNPDMVTVDTSLDGNVYTVAVSYDISGSMLLSSSIIPLPEGPITRQARVRLSSL